ncbi:MAG: acyltransferase [Bacteroidetes bacterium]|nr:acyltransferase [Bacteroidota bacterium]
MKVYFKNLDGIRFFAAFIVLLHHAFYFKFDYSPGYSIINYWLRDAGRIGVNLFFVLSGFLISYLLFVEKDNTGTVSYKKFYIRRILRIWPLYFACGITLTLAGPYIAKLLGVSVFIDWSLIARNMLFLFLFAINFQLAFTKSIEGVFQISWSVCIEEQFYLIWPIIINKFRKRLITVFIFLFLLRMLFRVLVVIIPHYYSVTRGELVEMNYLLIFDKLDLFGGGMLFAYFHYNRSKFPKLYPILMNRYLQFVMLALAMLYSFAVIRPTGEFFYYADHSFNILLFGYMLLAAVSENSILNLENRLLKTLGRVSFGIYLFHTVVCQVTIIFFKKFVGHSTSHFVYDFLYPLTCLAITCSIAYLSYEYFEKRFLLRKKKFSTVVTRV